MKRLLAMTSQQLLFCNTFLDCCSVKTAAEKAEYSPKYMPQLYQQLSNPESKIGRYVNKHKQAALKSSAITRNAKRNKLWQIAERHAESNPFAAIKALNELNRMDGHHAPVSNHIKLEKQEQIVFDQQIPEFGTVVEVGQGELQ